MPRFFEMQCVRDRRWAENLWGVPVVRLPRHPRRLPLWRVKRAIDVLGAAAGLVVAAPVPAVCTLAVRVEGGPGVLFRQDRVGVDGRRFTLYIENGSLWQDVTIILRTVLEPLRRTGS